MKLILGESRTYVSVSLWVNACVKFLPPGMSSFSQSKELLRQARDASGGQKHYSSFLVLPISKHTGTYVQIPGYA